jgi:hypothetical protein
MTGIHPRTSTALSDEKGSDAKQRNVTHIPLWRIIIYAALTLSFAMLLFEGIVRVGFYFADDRNPYYLKFGFVPDIETHSAEFDGYTKFQPNSTYHYRVNEDLTYSMTINSDGFRSTENFIRPKPPGTLRITALGESSTFGLASNDGETYSDLLQRNLREHAGRQNVEVYNLGIPHYRTNNILALARSELAGLEPDIVTFYAGYNNSAVFRSRENAGKVYGAKEWLKAHSVMYRALHPYAVTAYSKLMAATGRDIVGLPHLALPVELPATQVGELRAAAVQEFSSDLNALADEVEAMGADLVLITQSFTLRRLPGNLGLYDRWRPYDEEVAYVDSILATKGAVPAPYSTLLIHRDLMQAVRDVAQQRGLILVDGLAALDADREKLMATYVHLTLEGNERLAAAIEEALVQAKMVAPSEMVSEAGNKLSLLPD